MSASDVQRAVPGTITFNDPSKDPMSGAWTNRLTRSYRLSGVSVAALFGFTRDDRLVAVTLETGPSNCERMLHETETIYGDPVQAIDRPISKLRRWTDRRNNNRILYYEIHDPFGVPDICTLQYEPIPSPGGSNF